METQTMPSTSGGRTNARDFFINLGAIVSLYVLVGSLINLLFTVINTAFPQIRNGYGYIGSQSISWPVAMLIILFPVFIILMWLLEKDYKMFPEKQNSTLHRWLSYITLFAAGAIIIGDLVTVLYYFLDGQELTTGFLLKVMVLLVLATGIFSYYLSDVLGKLTTKSRQVYRMVAFVVVLGSIVWGFSVLGSPRTQRLYKHDDQKVNDLMNINNEVMNHYAINGILPESLDDLSTNYFIPTSDSETGNSYVYEKTGDLTYSLCTEFNKDSMNNTGSETYSHPFGTPYWVHPAGHYCFEETVNPNTYSKPMPVR